MDLGEEPVPDRPLGLEPRTPAQTTEEAPACPWLLLGGTFWVEKESLAQYRPVCYEQPFRTPMRGYPCVSRLLALGGRETE